MRASSREVYCITERYKIRVANDASVRHNLRRADYIGQMSLQFHLLHVNCGVIHKYTSKIHKYTCKIHFKIHLQIHVKVCTLAELNWSMVTGHLNHVDCNSEVYNRPFNVH